MAIMTKLFLASVCFMAFIFTATSMINSGDISWWCNQTPYPEPCKYHMNHGPRKSPYITASSSISRTQFRDMAIQVAMSYAVDGLDRIKSLGPKWQSGSERAVWTNCGQLYDNTVFQLKKSLLSYVNPTPSDIQTWLSAALTNLHTCQSSFFLINATKNLTLLISNTLAINIVLSTKEEQSYRSGLHFPSWLSRQDQTYSQGATFVVAQDGSGNFGTIQQALDASENMGGCERFVIYVKKGIYNEYIEIRQNMRNITMLGDGPGATIITGSRSNVSGYNTYDSATVKVCGDGFIAHGISFENTAGPNEGQAVALLSKSDHSTFYRCGFHGYQDTLWVMAQRQFYQQCNIYGTVDFIFGNARVVLQNCNIYARRPMPGGGIVITAQGRDIPDDNTGISIENSRVMAASDLQPVLDKYKVYLGRPWHPYSRTVYMETFLDKLVDPAGWLKWDDNPSTLSTLYFGEYRNYGPGSSTHRRVKWPGYKIIIDKTTAEYFTVANFIDGQSWLPKTGVPFFSGLKRGGNNNV